MSNYNKAPSDLPKPHDDGACAHLQGQSLPSISLSSTTGTIALSELPKRTILFIYPATGTPGQALPEDWDSIPGARGCTPESLAFKNAFEEITKKGYSVYGMSGQTTEDHREAKARLELPYELISDNQFELTKAMKLPTFKTKAGKQYMTRVTLIVQDGKIQTVLYPVFPTSEAANMVLSSLS